MSRMTFTVALALAVAGCGGDKAAPTAPEPTQVAEVSVSPETPTVNVGASVQLEAMVTDANGAPIEGRSVSWQTSDPAIATVSGSGNVTGVATGIAQVTARVEGKSGTAQVTVRTSGGLAITSVSPSPLIEGQAATISGEGFGHVASNARVTIDGVIANVTSATPQSLEIVVPSTGCKPARTVDVQVRMLTTPSNVVRQPLAPAETITMAVGDQLLARNPAGFCLQFLPTTSAESYLIGVQSVSEDVTSLTPAVVASLSGSGSVATGSTSLLAMDPPAPSGGPVLPKDALLRHRRAETRLRTLDREFLRQTRRSVAASTASPAGSPSVPGGLHVGDHVSMRVPQYDEQCTRNVPITAVVRRVTNRSIWLEDVANPPTGYGASHYQDLSGFFDGSVLDTDMEYFGQIRDFDHNGRVAIVVTGQVNRMTTGYGELFTLAGMVKPVDNFPASTCPSSNEGEIIYLRAPDPAGAIGSATGDLAEEMNVIKLLLAHEFVHVIQFGHTVPGNPAGAVPKENWLLEGQATMGEEVVGHRMTGRAAGRNYGYSVAYDRSPTVPSWYRAFDGLGFYFGFDTGSSRIPDAPEQCTWLGLTSEGNDGPCISNDHVAYDVAWSFLRWVSDQVGPQAPGGEQQIQRALIDARSSGFEAFSEVIGLPADVLLANWAAALYVDDRFPGMAAALTYKSWNLFDVANNWPATARLVPRSRAFGAFTDQVSVGAGSTAYFRVGGAGRPGTAIRVRSPSGNNLPEWMRVWIVRVQ